MGNEAAASARSDTCDVMEGGSFDLTGAVDNPHDYIASMREDGEHAGDHELLAAALLFNIRILINLIYTVTPGGVTDWVYPREGGGEPDTTLRFCTRYSHFWATEHV